MKQTIRQFDQVVGTKVGQLPRWLQLPMEFFTLIGQPPFTVGIAAVVLGYGLALSKAFYIEAGTIAILTVIVSALLKLLLRRTRPLTEYVEHMLFKTFSFPSGHAAGALVGYGLGALVISTRWPEYAVITWAIGLGIIFCISLSRIYLGAHYASDIIGGWLVGGLGLLAIFVLGR